MQGRGSVWTKMVISEPPNGGLPNRFDLDSRWRSKTIIQNNSCISDTRPQEGILNIGKSNECRYVWVHERTGCPNGSQLSS
jgi:hypothetical protein